LPFCPKCRCEYNVGVEECVDCHVPLVLRRPDRRPLFEVDLDELLVPAGAVVCLAAALVLLGLRQSALNGQVADPLGAVIANQPGCLTVFYIIAAVMSVIVLLVTLIRWVTGRR
jgi:hypothetical protein